MQPPISTTDRWHLPGAALPPVVLGLVAAVVAVLGFVLWSANTIDERAAERQNVSISNVIQGRLARITHELASVALSDETLTRTGSSVDVAWIDKHLGNWLGGFFGHDRTIVLNAQNAPIYLMLDGAQAEPSAFEAMAGVLDPLVARLRAFKPDQPPGPRLDLPPRYQGGPPIPPPILPRRRMPPPPAVIDIDIVDGKPAIVIAMAIVSDSGRIRQQPGTGPVLIGVKYLDERTARQIEREYLLDNARFSLVETTDPARAVYPVINTNGRIIAFFEWNRNRPGYLILTQTGPVLLGAFVIAFILILLLLAQLRRSSTAIHTSRLLAVYEASHDALTGLNNRVSFDAQLAEAIDDQQNQGAHMTLFMLDLDRFKRVNDTLGHQAGDELICAVGDRLRAIFGSKALIARLGGDEFAILNISPDRPVDVMAVSARVIDAIGQPFALSRFNAHVGASIGISLARVQDAEASELLRKADIALYEAKAAGRNRALVFEEQMNELLQLQHTIEAELRLSLTRHDQLSVVFQPLVGQRSRKVVGAEALARWHHPKYGQISPGRFIPVAESTGLIEALGEFVLRRACEMGATVPGRTIAVNISPTQLRNPRFSHLVFDILHETGMRPIDLELEITESILLDDEHISSQNLRTFRTAGIQIALDDFGTGYSSLSYLQRYPVDRIKIDRSFVTQLSDGHVSVEITKAIVTLAHAMSLEVTAEGVETEAQAKILSALGCNILQGFLFSKGVDAEHITAIFAAPENAVISRRRRSAEQ